jgi:hypothetical protein
MDMHMRSKKTAAGLVLLLSIFGFSFAQGSNPERLVIPKLSHAPKIDGVLDNPIWSQEALKIEHFLQLSPKEKGVPSEKTVAYLGYDEKNLYIAFRCFDSEVKKLRASVTNRDNCIDDDWIIIFLDTFNEKRRAFSFFVNPLGIQMDAIRMEEGGNDNMDTSWDTVFESGGKIDDQGYTVEMAVPFKSLRFPDREEKIWNIVLARNIPRKGEVIIWPEMSRNIPGLLTQGGQFSIPGKVVRGKNLEVMPIATSLKREGQGLDFQPGVNVKYGLSSDLTLDFTLNPDFSHIEADAPQIDVNLRYALRYPEKRPFFMEGMEIFRFPEIEMVYTRRIIDPAAGVKATGKIGRLTYGVLSSYDTSPTESLWDVHGGVQNTDQNALFNIVRLKADVFKESYLGFCLTDKEIDGTFNRVAGLDGQFKLKNKYFINFQAIGSKTRFEDKETGLAPALYADFYYFTKYWGAGVFWESIHPDFEAASGFVNRTDYKTYGASTQFNLFPDKKFLNQVNFGLRVGQRDDYFGSATQDEYVRANLGLRFTEFNRAFIQFENAMERYEGIKFHKNSLSLEAENNIIGWMPFGLFFEIGDSINYDPDDPFLGWGISSGLRLNFKPSKRLVMGLDYSKSTFWEKWGGARLWDYNVIRQRTSYQLSKTLSLRAIVDYNLFYDQVFGSFLVSYVLRPGTVFFFGVDTNYFQNDFRRFQRDNYSVFVKFSYWWRV